MHKTIIQYLSAAGIGAFVHCTLQQHYLLAVATLVRKAFTTNVEQMHHWRHCMTAHGL